MVYRREYFIEGKMTFLISKVSESPTTDSITGRELRNVMGKALYHSIVLHSCPGASRDIDTHLYRYENQHAIGVTGRRV